jgi:membrane protein DedA with SNARE-associated domain
MHWVYHTVQHLLTRYGYWAEIGGILGESAGLPLPGETVLMFASFVAYKHQSLEIAWVIVVGIGAAILGDNLGFLVGRKLGSRLIGWMKKLFFMSDTDIGAAKDQIRRRGGATVFWARYIFGLRMVAGPLAGVLGMQWKRFLLFNGLGGAAWVCTMCLVSYAFSSEFNTLLGYLEKASWGITGALFTIGYVVWRKQKSHFKKRQAQHQTS